MRAGVSQGWAGGEKVNPHTVHQLGLPLVCRAGAGARPPQSLLWFAASTSFPAASICPSVK